jgi:hypothetical protein
MKGFFTVALFLLAINFVSAQSDLVLKTGLWKVKTDGWHFQNQKTAVLLMDLFILMQLPALLYIIRASLP